MRQEYSEIMKKFINASKITNLKMTENQKRKMEIYYADSVRKLEVMTGRNLSMLWF